MTVTPSISTMRDMVWMNVTGTPGTGNVTLNAALTGYQTAAAAGVVNGEINTWRFADGNAWEISTCVYTSSGTSLARTLIASSTGSLLSLSSAATCFIDNSARDIGGPMLIGKLIGANLAITTDQAIALTGAGTFTPFYAFLTNASTTPVLAAGAIYSGASKSNAIFGAPSETFTVLTSALQTRPLPNETSTAGAALAMPSYAGSGTIYLSLSTANALACTADVYIYGLRYL